LFYPGGGAVVSLPCTNSGSVAKRLKENDSVVTQPGDIFGGDFFFKRYFSNSKNNKV